MYQRSIHLAGRLGLTHTHYTLLCIKQKTDEDLLSSTGNATQYSAMAHLGKQSKEEATHRHTHTPQRNMWPWTDLKQYFNIQIKVTSELKGIPYDL